MMIIPLHARRRQGFGLGRLLRGQRVLLSGSSTVNWIGKVLSTGAFTGAGVGACAGRVPNLTLTAAGVGAVSAVGTDQGIWSPSTFADGIGTDLLLWLRAEDDATPQAITGGGREFTATDKGSLQRADSAFFSPGDTEFVWCGWVKHDHSGDKCFVWQGGLKFSIYQSVNSLCAELSGGAIGINFNYNNVSGLANKWIFVVVWHDPVANKLNMQVNNGSVFEANTSGAPQDDNTGVSLGAKLPSLSQPVGGCMAQWTYFKGTVARTIIDTAAERTWLYNSGNGRLTGEIAARYPTAVGGTDWDGWNLNETSGTANAVSYSAANDLTPTFGELVTNGAFASDTGWTKGTGWTIAAGVGTSDGSQGADSDLEQAVSVATGHRYATSFAVSGYSAGNITAVVGGTEGTDRAADGTHTQNITVASTDSKIMLRADLDFVGNVDNYSVVALDIPPCNGPSTDIASDSSANGNHGTFNGDPTAWSTDVPHGSPNPTVFNTIDETTYPGVMLGFASPDTARSTDIAVGLTGTSLLFDGSDDYVLIGNIGNITSCDFYVKSVATNQELFTLANSTATAVTVVGGTLTFGASLSASAILVDGVSKTAGEAGALINDGTWHRVQFTLTSVAASDVRLGTDSSAYGNIYLDDVKLGAATHWGFDEADTRVLPVLGAGLSLNISYADTRCMTANAIAIGGGSCTISMWSKAVSGSYLDFNNGTQHTLGWLSNHTLRFSPNGGGANLDSSQFGQNGLWNHVCAVHTGTTSSIYMNGVLVAQGTTASLGAASGSLKLGEWSNIKEDDVRVYSEALTAAKILYLYTEGDVGTDPTATNLVGHWKLDDGAASEPVDGDPILEWRSHEGYQFQQLTASKRPLYETSAVNSKAGIRFDGTDDLLRLASSLFATTQGYLWIVCRLDAVPDSYQTFLASSDEAGTTKLFAIERGNTANAHVNIRQNDAGTELLWDGDTTLAINTDYCLKLNGVPTVTVDVNNDEQTMNADTGTPPSEIWPGVPSARDNVTLGALKHTSETRFLSGLICEVIAVKSTTAAGQIAKVDSYLTAQYGMTV